MQQGKQKNIIFLMTDQHRWDHVGYENDAKLKTPNIDFIAKGTAFTNCQSTNPVCLPARTSLITGRHTRQIATLAMSGDLSLQYPTFMQSLQNLGYYTVGVGKFHFYQSWPFKKPRTHQLNLLGLEEKTKTFGFDDIYEVSGKQLILSSYCEYSQYLKEHGIYDEYLKFVNECGENNESVKYLEEDSLDGKPFPFDEEHYIDNVISKKIIEKIKNRPKDKSLYLFGSFCSPHNPHDPPISFLENASESTDDYVESPTQQAYSDKIKSKLRILKKSYRAMISYIDYQIGNIIEVLKDENILNETILVFSADHGSMLGDHGRLLKRNYYRGSQQVPLAIRHPDYVDEKKITSPVSLLDLAASFIDIAGGNPKEELSSEWPAFTDIIPSRSLLPLINASKNSVRDYTHTETNNDWISICSEDFKYVYKIKFDSKKERDKELLFNLIDDPKEIKNLVSDNTHETILNQFREERISFFENHPTGQIRWTRLDVDDNINYVDEVAKRR